ncbi:MAG: hypothetical protein OEW48_12530 [Phycisphaerae bacterium]|nr:hypothetical protein [Phycisphaerae bacterium]
MIYKDKKERILYMKRLSIVLIVVAFLCICIWILFVGKSDRTSLPPEIVHASKEFKAKAGYRVNEAKILLPYLKVGMSKEEIRSLLGEPDSKKGFEYFACISYIVGRSNMIDVFLDENEKVIHVDSVWSEYSNPFERAWPLMRPGMTKQYILRWLGGPQKELKDGKEYQYRDDQFVFIVSFDMNDIAVKLEKNEI